MNAPSYNRGVIMRAHKLCFETFFRLTWKAFLRQYSEREEVGGSLTDESVKERLAAFRDKIGAKAIERGGEDVESLLEDLKGLVEQFKGFKEERLASSKTFAFWKEYYAMVDLLLQFIKAERTANWNLHLSAVAAMTPYFFAMDRHNYSIQSGKTANYSSC